ncbi:GTP-binding protein [Caldicellulosiruptor bescii]|uniref:Large ribosomal subunit assembly factor BipA n=2 Tax=Caldicellulosiruptor bescii TaxID=31899 RepID=B9MQ55_CALBD|nr:translational GTPase TypA [Caldicellulosiruptor bescii]ACM59847.1 GTP-binding protein TypA [Caldicellulosiruptor bescii DSM 6725]PBC87257.1 GTP-binding protein [Caldicellulosiruptor bescii]PBC90196.1 GTP-binding protein [Caldicellulosiruptor bescii]PBD04375.1 GTP-binding protein [Caldicellulosiruptor bescii]PBD05994.1 GTP-binding protein [Caldicellulosiruptor bescii]
MLTQRDDIRNIAIIAHVDHGKTTLVDSMLKQSGIFRENQVVEERVLDSNQLEREKGITIMAKNTAIMYKGIKINIIDTPGHADFGSEVERSLVMADGVLLVVDAYEGPMPQTKFVLRKALQLKLKPIVVINKIDRPFARPYEVLDKVLDLFIELGADEDQLDFPYVFASAKEGIAKFDLEDESHNLEPLFEMIINNIPAPTGEIDAPFQMIVTSIDYDNYLGRIAIGKVVRGSVKLNQQVAVCTKQDGVLQKTRVTKLYQFEGLKRVECSEAKLGDIVAIAGIDGINIGQTVADAENPEPLEFIKIDEPTISMIFSTNDSPFAGKEGEYVTSRHLRERLFKELERNVGLKVEETNSPDSFKVSGRGELHLAILIETMRREGYEFQVSKPQVITKIVNGELYEPYEYLIIDVPEEFMGTVMEKLGPRRAQLQNMTILNDGFMRLEFIIPARGLIGFSSEFLTDTKGNGIMNHVFYDYMPYAGDIPERNRGALIAFETGEAVTYGLYNAQERGRLFIGPGTQVYEGMIVGESSRPEDIVVNVCKKKHLTNMRSATADEALRLTPPLQLSLEECIEFLAEDELLEVTPKSLRLRKKILNHEMRKKMEARAKKEEKEPVY